jgi:hypothetical protein
MKTTRQLAIITAALVSIYFTDPVWGGTFGTGANRFDIEFKNIDFAGNLPDNTGNPNPVGAVPYQYRIAKFEVSEDMIVKANAAGALGITKDNRGIDKPATSISWNEAARFVNWLNDFVGSPRAYKFAVQPGEAGYNANNNQAQLWTAGDGAAFNPANPYRNAQARFFLPNNDEWYKAAYYDPTAGVYYDYPTGSDAAPTGVDNGVGAGSAVYTQAFGDGPADISDAGGLSPYGTMAQGGNVFELQETDFNLVNGPSTDNRGLRGGYWSSGAMNLQSTNRLSTPPTNGANTNGFRVASVIPEPSTLVLFALAGLGLVWRRVR